MMCDVYQNISSANWGDCIATTPSRSVFISIEPRRGGSTTALNQPSIMAIFSKNSERPPAQVLDSKETGNSHVEDLDSIHADEKAQGDYSGARAKVDPVEIRLARKLDLRIMPILWAMYFLNYVCIASRCPPIDLVQLMRMDIDRPQCNCQCTPQ